MNRRALVSTLVTFILVAPSLTLAVGLSPIVPQSGQGSDCNGPGGCQSICDIAILAQNVLNDGIYVAIFLSAILFAWAGWKIVAGSSAGNPGEVSAGKQIFWNVGIGLVIIISAWLIVSVIMAALTNNSDWNNFCGTGTSVALPEMNLV